MVICKADKTETPFKDCARFNRFGPCKCIKDCWKDYDIDWEFAISNARA